MFSAQARVLTPKKPRALMLDVIALTKSLCDIESITGNEKAVVDFVAGLLSQHGFHVERQVLPYGERANLFASRSANPRVLMTTHLDTVPPHFPARESEDKEWLIGRGVCDAKGIAAAMICAACNLKKEDVALLFVVGEETISDGAKHAAKALGRSFEFIIDGEPTDSKLASSMKGALVFELSVPGKSGHSAYPQSGHSATHQLIHDTQRLLDFAWPASPDFGETTINIGVVKGGQAPNVIAADAYCNGVMRLACSVADAEKAFEQVIDKTTVLRVLSRSEPRKLRTVPGFDTCQVAFGCDIPHLEKLGVPLLFGPGSILEAHTKDEKIRIADLREAVSGYERLCRSLL